MPGLAAREFGLGLEGLERFDRGAPPREVHECVFAVLALAIPYSLPVVSATLREAMDEAAPR